MTPPRNRDEFVPKHPARAQTAAPVEVDPETSEAYEDPAARAQWRGEQPWEKRVARTEVRLDEQSIVVSKMDGKLDIIVLGMQDSAAERNARREREEKAEKARAAFWTGFFKIIVPTITALGIAIAGIVYGRGH